MGRARNLADVIGGNFDIPSTSLDNAQAALEAGDITADLIADGAVTNAKIASGVDAGKLTTGTIPAARIADGSIAAGKLDTVYQTPLTAGTDYLAPDGDGSGLSGLSSSSSIVEMTMESGGSLTATNAVTLTGSAKVGAYPAINDWDSAISIASLPSTTDRVLGASVDSFSSSMLSNGRRNTVAFKRMASNGTFSTGSSSNYSCTVSRYGSAIYSPSAGQAGATCMPNVYWTWAGTMGYNNGGNDSKSQFWWINVASDGSQSSPKNFSAFQYDGAAGGWGGFGFAHGPTSFGYKGCKHFVMLNARSRENSTGTHQMGTFDGTTGSNSGISAAEYTFWSGKLSTAIQLSNGYFVAVSGNTVYVDSGYSTNNFSTTTPTEHTIISSGYSGTYRWQWLSETLAVMYYSTLAGETRIALVSFSSTGVPTVEDDVPVSFSGSIRMIEPGNTTGEVLKLNSNGNLVESFKYNPTTMEFETLANGNLAVGKIGLADNQPSSISNIALNNGNQVWMTCTNTLGNPTLNKITISDFTTFPFDLIGVATESTTGSTAKVAVSGVVDGYTGLTPGYFYYLTTDLDGTLTTSSVSGVKVGKAISTTQILLEPTL